MASDSKSKKNEYSMYREQRKNKASSEGQYQSIIIIYLWPVYAAASFPQQDHLTSIVSPLSFIILPNYTRPE